MGKSAVVIVPTTGTADLSRCVESVLAQSYADTYLYVVCDGPEFMPKVARILQGVASTRLHLLCLPMNVGGRGFYGHRVYAAASHLVDEDYVLYLDQDNWFDPEHVESMVDLIESKDLSWAHSLRKICNEEGEFIVNDECESLGRRLAWTGVHHVDTNAFCLKRQVAVAASSAWHGGWGQDRVFYKALDLHFPKYDCTGKHSVNYRLTDQSGAVTPEFFLKGNAVMAR